MKICCLSRVTMGHGICGGMEFHLKALAEGLVRRKHDVEVVTTGHPQGIDQEEIAGVRYKYLPTPSARYRHAWWKASRDAVGDGGYDLIWGEGWAAEGVANLSLAKRPPLVTILHGAAIGEFKTRLRAWKSPRMLALGALMLWRHFTWRAHLERAAQVISISEGLADTVGSIMSDGRQRISVIPNGVLVDRFEVSEQKCNALREQLDIPLDAKVLISVSRLSEEKGVHLALDVLSKLAREDVYLVIVGKGPYEETLKQKISGSAYLKKFVRLVGFVDNAEIPKYLCTSDVFLFPTLRDEGLPISVLEAMAASLPVVASDVYGISQAVTTNSEGMLLPMGDVDAFVKTIRDLIEAPSLITQLGEAAHKRARLEFGVEQMIRRTETAFRKVAGA